MSRELNSNHLSFRCPLRKEDLHHSDTGYFCQQCSRQILDLSDCSIEDAIKLQKKHGAICGFVAAAGLSATLALSSCATTKKEPSESSTPPVPQEEEMILGFICPPEELEKAEG